MIPYTEVEIKFAADHVTEKQFHETVHGMTDVADPLFCKVKSFVHVSGYDTYYNVKGSILRLRSDGERTELTYKERFSDNSIEKRKEINVLVDPRSGDSAAHQLVSAIGGEREFFINKSSRIYHVTGRFDRGDNALYGELYRATIALYDVKALHDPNERRFLEVEIENDSDCTEETAVVLLDKWKKQLQYALGLSEPLNQSLYEIYKAKQ